MDFLSGSLVYWPIDQYPFQYNRKNRYHIQHQNDAIGIRIRVPNLPLLYRITLYCPKIPATH
ncbi:ORF1210 [White spot syndrome virus]|uniref:ORF1210 n=1 Tax=White spot syndrome virus TaxID=342409 RepID=A0A2D3I742_9VIRU|nr:ORF1210 [White spot syndrome virus]